MAYHVDDTIVAVASPPGGAARAIVRLSGPGALDCVEALFRPAANARTVNPSRDNDSPSRARKEAGYHTTDVRRTTTASSPPPPLPHDRGSVLGGSAPPRSVVSGCLHLSGLHSPLPADLYLWPDDHSYTGQPVAEFHTLGSPPLVDALVRAAREAGARLARPGEFTLRAFLAGRIDLTQAEAVLGVIDAADGRQLDVALTQLAGGLSHALSRLRDTLVDLLGHLEAGLDFADEDLPFITAEEIAAQLAAARAILSDLTEQLRSRHRAGERTRVVLVGRPNAGKSSLFNALAQASGAIVSHEPGTTRDYLTAEVDLNGVRFDLIDTAGIDGDPEQTNGCLGQSEAVAQWSDDGWLGQSEAMPQGSDAHWSQGVAEAIARRVSARADVRIHCVDLTKCDVNQGVDANQGVGSLCFGQEADLPSGCSEKQRLPTPLSAFEILVLTKADLLPATTRPAPADDETNQAPSTLRVSSVTGEGLDALRARLRAAVRLAQSAPDQAVASTAARCAESLRAATEALDRAADIARAAAGEELIAAELRRALEAIGEMAGTIHTEDVLDRVFSRFCIGK